jgi:iron complex outermembrane receptor protein
MSSNIKAAARRRTFWLASGFLVPVLCLGISAAKAEPASPDQLPPIEVSPPVDQTRTRAKPISDEGSGSRRVVPNVAPASNPNAAPTGDVAAVRQFNGIVGASATVITSEDIARSPAQTVQEIIAQTPGVQLTSFYGGVNGAGTTVDLRGFGAFASSNTLVLMNGRRLNDLDLQGVDLSTIPRDSIERIEITRGNSGAVLYGDNAIGGVINIVTKTGTGGPPVSIRAEGGVGSFNQSMAAVSTRASSGPWSASFYGKGFKSDGYRVNNTLDQRNGVGERLIRPSDSMNWSPTEGAQTRRSISATDRMPTLPVASPRHCGMARTSSSTGVTETNSNNLASWVRLAVTPSSFPSSMRRCRHGR